jgi:hypothetical protein
VVRVTWSLESGIWIPKVFHIDLGMNRDTNCIVWNTEFGFQSFSDVKYVVAVVARIACNRIPKSREGFHSKPNLYNRRGLTTKDVSLYKWLHVVDAIEHHNLERTY